MASQGKTESCQSDLPSAELKEILDIVTKLHNDDKLQTSYEDVVSTIQEKFESAQSDPTEGRAVRVLYKNIKRAQHDEDDLVEYIEDYVQSAQVAQKLYNEKLHRIHNVSRELIQRGIYKNIGDPLKCQTTFTMYLSLIETEWKKPGILPPLHARILALHESGNHNDELEACIRKIITDGLMSSEVQVYEREVNEKMANLQDNTPIQKVLKALGAGLIAGLSTLPLLVPQASALSKVFASMESIVITTFRTGFATGFHLGLAYTSTFLVGIVFYNTYRYFNKEISSKEFGQNTAEAVAPLVISAVASWAIPAVGAVVGSPVWVTSLIIAGIGLTSVFVCRPIIKLIVNKLSNAELDAAYALLGLTSNASDEEIRKAYRTFSRKYHPDMQARDGTTEEQINQAREKLHNVQNAYQLIVATKCRAPGFFDRIDEFFEDLWKTKGKKSGSPIPLTF